LGIIKNDNISVKNPEEVLEKMGMIFCNSGHFGKIYDINMIYGVLNSVNIKMFQIGKYDDNIFDLAN